MTDQKITSDKIVNIAEQQGEPLYVSSYHEQNSFQHLPLQPNGGTSLSYSQPKADMSGYDVQFDIATQNWAVSTFTSYFEYQGQFTFKFAEAGKYILNSGKWFFQEAILSGDKYSYYNEGVPTPRTCISEGALNSFAPIQLTYPSFQTSSRRDNYVYLQKTFFQAQLSSDYQNSHSSTWFNSGSDQWVVEWFPSTVTNNVTTYVSEVDYLTARAAANGKTLSASAIEFQDNDRQVKNLKGTNVALQYAYIQVKKTFICPFDLLNMQFCHEHLQYFNALRQQSFQLHIQFLDTFLAYVFDHSNGLVLVNGQNSQGYQWTGLTSNTLHLMIKRDNNFRSDIQEGGLIVHKLQLYDVFQLATGKVLNGTVDEQINRPLESINDIYLMYQPLTNNKWEYYRQVSTFYPCDVVVKLENNELDNSVETIFPYLFNLRREGNSDRVFNWDVSNLETFRYEVLRCFNYNQNKIFGTTKSFNLMDWLKQYAFIAVNLQQWQNDLGVDVVYDGINNSAATNLSIYYQFANYNEYQQEPLRYDPINQNSKTNISNVNCFTFLDYDAFAITNTRTGDYEVEENIKKYLKK